MTPRVWTAAAALFAAVAVAPPAAVAAASVAEAGCSPKVGGQTDGLALSWAKPYPQRIAAKGDIIKITASSKKFRMGFPVAIKHAHAVCTLSTHRHDGTAVTAFVALRARRVVFESDSQGNRNGTASIYKAGRVHIALQASA